MSRPGRSDLWRYSVCGLLLLATMLNYMDRQTLAQLGTTIRAEFGLNNTRFGQIDSGFSLAFATGAIVFGILADRFGVRWLYPGVLIGWSLAGVASAVADRIGAVLPTFLDPALGADDLSPASRDAYLGFLACRIALGFFEAGHWPCALVTTQAILARKDRSFGNSLLQSGAALGAIFTPLIIITMLPLAGPNEPLPPGAWRPPFLVIGLVGMLWVVPWLALVRSHDVVRGESAPAEPEEAPPARGSVLRMFAVLVVVVITINATWQFIRLWLPMFLEEQHHFNKVAVGAITSAYFVATDIGCIGFGFLAKWLAGRGWDVHRARMFTFAICTALVALGVVVALVPGPAAGTPQGWLLVGLLLLIGAGALGLFPNYYSFTQELSRTHQGKISGILGTITWIGSAIMQPFVGRSVDASVAAGDPSPYSTAFVVAGVIPVLALLALVLFWPRSRVRQNAG